tara:strand:+ start:1938 stop:2942 length:1005 start_codon:yes stop_codon:yes gene_type:complete
MAYEPQLFIGKISSITPQYNNIVFINGTIQSGQSTITGITPQSGTQDVSLLRVGMSIQSYGGGYATNPTIVSIDSSTQITVNQTATANVTNVFGASLSGGKYFFNSASIIDPQQLVNVNSITGSLDENYNASLSPVYAVVGQASTSLGGTQILGKFFNYKITEVTYRDLGSAEISAFIEWGGEGTEADSGNALLASSNQTLAIGAMSETSSAVTIFDSSYITGTAIGSSVAGYQQTVVGVIDQAITSSVGTGFPFTGSAQITGSLAVTGSNTFLLNTDNELKITKNSGTPLDLLNVDGNTGVINFNAYADADAKPTAVLGGIYFTSASLFIGLE